MFKQKDIDDMAEHYKEVQEKKDSIPPIYDAPFTTTILLIVAATAFMILKGYIT